MDCMCAVRIRELWQKYAISTEFGFFVSVCRISRTLCLINL